MAESPNAALVGEELQLLDIKLKQLKSEYEQYFIGSRPREPIVTRGDVQKLVVKYSNTAIQNTAHRFRFNNLCARYYALRRHWDETVRKIEEGTYERQVFRAKLRERQAGGEAPAPPAAAAAGAADPGATGGARSGDELFERYVEARRQCGEDVKGLSRERLDQLLAQQRVAIQQRYGCQEVRFRVVVEDGRAKLKATPVKTGPG